MVEYNLTKTPIVDIVNQIILYAAQHQASDIHFDPREDALMVRMRIDGDLQNHSLIPKAYERNLITRIKLVASMNITENRLPQDGAIKGRIGGKDLDMRVSVLPTNEGEKAVIRILDFQKGLGGLEDLNFSSGNYEKVTQMLKVSHGIILVTGATGSGKSTTTYSMLKALNKEETNIITVEDPIEMNIEGINQVQVNSEIGMTFATALRSILRQDPNIVLIGEIRDSETAQIAVRASITGHLVLSTIHTNNSLSTIERLLDMDVERYLLSSALTGIISQKLTRTLCNHCKQLRPVTKYEKHLFKRVLGKNVKHVYDAVGCDKCHGGFSGRIALQEVLYISEKLRDKIGDDDVDKEELRGLVYDGDTVTLLEDALDKVVEGYTTFQEVYRVVDIDLELDNSIRALAGDDEDFDELDIIDAFAKDYDITMINEIFDFEDERFTKHEDPILDDETDIFDNIERNKLSSFKPEEFSYTDTDELELEVNNTISNLAGGAAEFVTGETLDLDNVEFDYKIVPDIDEVPDPAAHYYSNDEESLFQITTAPEDDAKTTPAVSKKLKAKRQRIKKKTKRPYEAMDIIDAFKDEIEIIDAFKEEKRIKKEKLEVINAFE